MKDVNGIDELLKDSDESDADEYIERHERMHKQRKLNEKLQRIQGQMRQTELIQIVTAE